jgi:hypothetical protein
MSNNTDTQPPKTDPNSSSRGENIAKKSVEPGRTDLGTDASGRHAGGSTARMADGIDPLDPVDPKSPNIPPG